MINSMPCEQTPLSRRHANDDSSRSSESATTMDDSTRIIVKICIDFAVLVCVGIPILLFFVIGDPYQRGFFCDDESIKHPFHDSTIRNWMLYLIGLLLPLILITCTEVIKSKVRKITSSKVKLRVCNRDVPTWMTNTYKHIGFFAFGAVVSQLTTDIGKYSIGRLRPHFFSVCQPIMPDGTTCADPINNGRYIEDFRCVGLGSNARMLKEMRLSFPSGHASFSAYTMIYTAIYLHARMTWRGSRLLKNFIQFLLITIAWYTSMTRISDYKHHWSDVLAGASLGTIVALVVSSFVSDLFERPSKTLIPQTRYELATPAYGNGNNQPTIRQQ